MNHDKLASAPLTADSSAPSAVSGHAMAPFEALTSVIRVVFDAAVAEVVMLGDDEVIGESPLHRLAVGAGREGAVAIADLRQHPILHEHPWVTGMRALRSYLGLPILDNQSGRLRAVLYVAEGAPDRFGKDEARLLERFGWIAAEQIALHELANHDHLTGVLTRRGFTAAAKAEMTRFRRYGRDSALILLDLDDFKRLNDTYGHPFGDSVLCRVAERCMGMKRAHDSLGRVGGEEFAFVLPEADIENAMNAADRFRKEIAQLDFPPIEGVRITASFGVAPLTHRITSVEEWMAAADGPLYSAKAAGKNTVRST